MKQDLKSLEAAVTKQGEIVKALKAQKLSKSEIQPAVDELIKLKADLNALLATEDGKGRFDRSVLESILLKRFFFAPSFQIYGGIAGLFDYGPPGCALQTNILSMWRQHFVLEEDMLEVECTNLTPEVVFKTSGHVERFADFMVKDLGTGDIFRADHLIKQVLTQRLEDDRVLRLGASAAAAKRVKPKGSVLEPEVREKYEKVLETLDNYIGDALGELIKTFDIRSPETNNELSKPTQFNMMFDTQIGPTGQFKGYLRPETAQGHFVNFKRLLEYNNQQMPFASASIGKSFRNEISPRQFILRVREFTMAEIEHFVHPERKQHPRFHEVRHVVLPLYSSDAQMAAQGPTPIAIGDAVEKGIVNNETLGYFITRIYLFLLRVGVDPKRIRLRQHLTNELAHYACDCWDADIESSYGWIECVGCADRSAYDLTVHAKKTGEKLIAQDTLPEPIIRDALVLKIVQSKIGPAFKKDAKAVLGYLESLKINEDEWDEKSLADIEKKLKEGDGKVDIVGTDGKTYTLTSEMISVSQTTLKISVREYTPNVIEPSFGIGRILYSLLEHAFYSREGDEQRTVFRFPAAIAPTKVLVAPISNNAEFVPFTNKIVGKLRRQGIANKVDDSASSIGRRYARNDEVGTPFAMTIDFQTIKDDTVTLRERDSTRQIRDKIDVVTSLVNQLVEGTITWEDVEKKHPAFVAQEV